MSNKPQHKNVNRAAALTYTEGVDTAPRVVAQGRGILAEKILQEAQKLNISIYKDPELLEALVQLDLGEFIPPELYEAVAQILAFVYYLDKN